MLGKLLLDIIAPSQHLKHSFMRFKRILTNTLKKGLKIFETLLTILENISSTRVLKENIIKYLILWNKSNIMVTIPDRLLNVKKILLLCQEQ